MKLSPAMKGIGLLAGILIFLFALLMLTHITPYFPYRPGVFFLSTKPEDTLARTDFLAYFFVHITSGWVVFMTGLFQFIPSLFRRFPVWHRRAGYVYTFVILILAAPSGLGLAWYANGGFVAKTGFAFLAIVWWLVTFQALRAIRRHQLNEHAEMMWRSYALTLAALSLRVETILLPYYFSAKPVETYQTVAWLCWTGNLFIAECLIRAGWARKLLSAFRR
ncbi:MAG: DUF2306 domain-containing protein [Siphonobacter aquaeclarae]|nr:DUF2306 domain-containing protein [Siphonobacter aquaeclarae]